MIGWETETERKKQNNREMRVCVEGYKWKLQFYDNGKYSMWQCVSQDIHSFLRTMEYIYTLSLYLQLIHKVWTCYCVLPLSGKYFAPNAGQVCLPSLTEFWNSVSSWRWHSILFYIWVNYQDSNYIFEYRKSSISFLL